MSELAIKSIREDQMLDRLDIQRFRGLKELSLTDAGRVNLIVGRNDLGKTSLIEAIRLLLSGDPRYLRRSSRNQLERKPINLEQSYRFAFYKSQSDEPLTIQAEIGDLQISADASIREVQGQLTLPVNIEVEENEEFDTIATLFKPDIELVLNIQTNIGASATIR